LDRSANDVRYRKDNPLWIHKDHDMLTGEIKSQIDRIWDAFWSGGISNPLEVIQDKPLTPDIAAL